MKVILEFRDGTQAKVDYKRTLKDLEYDVTNCDYMLFGRKSYDTRLIKFIGGNDGKERIQIRRKD